MNQELEILERWAQSGNAPDLVRKALSSATGVGEALSPQSLEKEMTNTIQRLSPELSLYMKYGKIVPIAGKFHEFDRITALPTSGSAQGETTVTPDSNSTYERAIVTLKIYRRKGKVTDFLIDVSREYLDTVRQETDNQLRVIIWDFIVGLYFGNKTANAFDFDGLETLVATNRNIFPGISVLGGVSMSSLKFLDDMIDVSDEQGGDQHNRAFLMSSKMVSAVGRFETTIRHLVDIGKLPAEAAGKFGKIMLPGGHVIETYRGVPLVKTTGLAVRETMTPTVTLAAVTTGGTMSDGTYYVRVSPVTNRGEQLASAEQTVVLSAGTAVQRIKITLSARHAGALYYKVYVGTAAGVVGQDVANSPRLYRIVPAVLYTDANGTLDLTNFNGQTGGNEIYVSTPTVSTEVATQLQNDLPLVAVNGVNPEYVILQDMDPIQGLGKIAYTNIETGGVFGGLVTTEPLAKTDAYRQFLMYIHGVLVPSFEQSSVINRGIRPA